MAQIRNETHASETASSDEVLSRLLGQLRPFQREAYEFATQGTISTRQSSSDNDNDNDKKDNSSHNPDLNLLGKGRILLADEMGLGKTVTSMAIMAHYRDEWPLLILCPASLRYTWPGEIEKFLPSLPPSAIYVVTGFDDADFFENTRKKSKIQIVVATYSLLQKRSAAARTLQQFQFKCVVADESHNLKQKNSQRTQLAIPILQAAKRLVLLSGTPALARPVELWTQVSVIAPGLFEDNYTKFTQRFCNARRGRFGWDVSGLSNAEELHSKLIQIMVRRLKCDVLTELPPKQRSIVPIQIPKGDKRRECESLMKTLTETRKSVADLVGDEANGAHFEARKLLMQAYQATGISKTSGICDYLLDWLRGSGSQKVLVFGHHKGVLDAIEVAVAKEFKGAGHIRIDGSTPSQERAVRVRKFQTSSHIRVAILSMTAAGVGLTLTAATTVMFAELHWTPGVLAQAEDRCHRMGQRNAVHVLYLVCRDPALSIDLQLWDMLGRKVGTLGKVVDGDKNASLDASVAEGRDNLGGGQSGQDELRSFFAETSSQEPVVKPKIPVKGTILSFFQKQKDISNPTASPTKFSAAATTTKSTSKTQSLGTQEISSSSSFLGSSINKKVEWACEACTFANTKVRPKSGRLDCEMCGTPSSMEYMGKKKGNNPIVTPLSISEESPKRDGLEIVIVDTVNSPTKNTYKDVIVIDGSPKAVNKSRSRKSATSPEDPTVLDAGPHTNRPNKEHAVDIDGIVVSPALSSTRKNFVRSKAAMLGDSKDTTGQPKAPALAFSVSRNSGRITIHYAIDGKSSLTNFEIEQVVTEDTADRLLHVKLNRASSSQPLGALIHFSRDAIHRGKELFMQH
jgi:SWI/SNF-related matrix-associated actin-dependent regulator 1 of chromatin subfamily A